VDDEQELAVAARQALERTDLIVVTGGASVGERDFAKAMFAPVGLEPVFSKVAIKPGKPVWLGRAGGRLVLGLPGNPTSALVTARLFLAPLVAGMSGQDPAGALAWRQDNLVAPLSANGDRETLERGRRTSGGVEPLSNQESGAQRVLALADVLIRRSPGDGPVNPGCRVSVLDF
jgi:Molybdopterin biosynthesis enzyme